MNGWIIYFYVLNSIVYNVYFFFSCFVIYLIVYVSSPLCMACWIGVKNWICQKLSCLVKQDE